VPRLPAGLTYVEVAAGALHTVARRSDGSVIAWGSNGYGQCNVPSLPAGLGYIQIGAGGFNTVAHVGAVSSYVIFGAGCAGSMPSTTLVPLDTPRIGAALQVHLDHLPVNAAFLIAGFSNSNSAFGPLPLDLGPIGMPGCAARVSIDFVALVLGSGGFADHRLPIPNVPGLVGVHFYQQALVLDPGAGNALGAVMSDAAAAVIGG